MLHWPSLHNFQKRKKAPIAIRTALGAGELGCIELWGISSSTPYAVALVLGRNSEKPQCILVAFRIISPSSILLSYLTTLTSCFLVCKMGIKIMSTSQADCEDEMRSYGWWVCCALSINVLLLSLSNSHSSCHRTGWPTERNHLSFGWTYGLWLIAIKIKVWSTAQLCNDC